MELRELAQLLGVEVSVLERLRAIEKEQRSKQQREGIERAKRQGVLFGRPRLPTRDLQTVYRLYTAGEISLEMAAAITGVSRSTVYRRIRELSDQS